MILIYLGEFGMKDGVINNRNELKNTYFEKKKNEFMT